MAKLKIGTRLYGGFGLLIALIIGLQLNAYINFSKLSQAVGWNNHTYQVMTEVDLMLMSLINIETGQRGFALTGNEASLEPLHAGLKAFKEHHSKAKSLTSDNATQQERLNRLETQQQQWIMIGIDPIIAVRRAVIAGKDTIENLVAMEQAGKGKQSMDAMRATIKDIRDAESGLLVSRSEQMKNQEKATQIVVIAGGIFALIIGITLAFLITRNLLKALGGEPEYAAEVANAIAGGNLAVDVNINREDNKSLLYAMKEMRDSLVKIVSEVRNGTDTIAAGSSQIAMGNVDLSSRTEQQASSLEETASSMEELTSTVKQNADNARQANQMAVSASGVAIKGGEVVSQVVTTMGSINESARKIVDIIGVIDGIAFQTNILALNAAVEAARAGEQGRGFAVVASEVRNLAQRSAAAAKEIKALIGDSVEKVDAGSKLVNEAGNTMDEIVESVKRVTDIMAEITAASAEQSSGIEQVNQAISQMDQVTQQNAALVEEATAAAESLQDQARNLEQVVSVFKLDSSQMNAIVARPVARPKPLAKKEASAIPTSKMARVGRTSNLSVANKPQAAVTPATAGGDWEEF